MVCFYGDVHADNVSGKLSHAQVTVNVLPPLILHSGILFRSRIEIHVQQVSIHHLSTVGEISQYFLTASEQL